MSDIATGDDTTKKADEALARAMRHHEAGRFDEALAGIDQLIADEGPMPKLRHYRGVVMVSAGEPKEGIEMMEAALKDAPVDPVIMTDLGSIMAQGGMRERAEELLREATELAPNYAMAHGNLGALLVLERKYGDAIRSLQDAIRLERTMIDAYTNLAHAFLATRRLNEAVDVLFGALALDRSSVTAHLALADALFRAERHESAEHHAKRALELKPGVAETHLRLGRIYGAMGRMDEAEAAYLTAARAQGLVVPSMSGLIHLRKTKEDAPEFDVLTKVLGRMDRLQDPQKAVVHMAAGKAFGDLGRYDEAFTHLKAGNDLNAEQVKFDPDLHVARAERLRAMSTPDLIKRCASTVVTEVQPIFIVGMPRSGTTLMDQMFSRHSRVQAGGEQPSLMVALGQTRPVQDALEEKMPEDDLSADHFAMLGEAYADAARRNGMRSDIFTDKLPANYLYATLAAMGLPRARFIFLRRHPLDCIFSNYAQNFGDNQPASNKLENLAVTYRQFDAMTRHALAVIPDKVREVHYEDVIDDRETIMKDLMSFCDLEWEDDVLDHVAATSTVNTASVAQVRQPVYRSSVAKWKHYAPHLGPLAETLKDYIPQEDYQFVMDASAGSAK